MFRALTGATFLETEVCFQLLLIHVQQ